MARGASFRDHVLTGLHRFGARRYMTRATVEGAGRLRSPLIRQPANTRLPECRLRLGISRCSRRAVELAAIGTARPEVAVQSTSRPMPHGSPEAAARESLTLCRPHRGVRATTESAISRDTTRARYI